MAADHKPGDLGQAIQDVTERAQILVREEIELAKAEVSGKAKKLGTGLVVAGAAGGFVVGAMIMLLHALAWLVWRIFLDSDDIWLGFLIVAVLLFLFAALAGFLAFRFIKKGAPPTPDMAIEEAQRIRETVSEAR